MAFLNSPSNSPDAVIHLGSKVIALHGNDYLPVAFSDGRFVLLRNDGGGSWKQIVAVSAAGRQRVVARAGFIAAEAVRGDQLVYAAEQSVDGGSRHATIWRVNWTTGRILGHVSQRRPLDNHATGGLDDVSVTAVVRDGVWLRPGLFWSGRTGQRPRRKSGFVTATGEVGNELEFHTGRCWRYLNPVTDKQLWRRCGTRVQAGFGVTPNGRWLLVNHGHWMGLRNTATGKITMLPRHISYGAWEGGGHFMGEKLVHDGSNTLLYNCSAFTGHCQRTGPAFDQIDTFTNTGPGDT